MIATYLLLVLIISEVKGDASLCDELIREKIAYDGPKVVDQVIFDLDFDNTQMIYARIPFTADGEEFMVIPRKYGPSSRLLVLQGYVDAGNAGNRYIAEPLSPDGIRIDIVNNVLTIFNGTSVDSAAAFTHATPSVSGNFSLHDIQTYLSNMTIHGRLLNNYKLIAVKVPG
ncbi:hypothetical protein CAPTEDRAFT_186359 [Capitella teleta]|uniref:Laminin G domain-containing protein n=1 Tax=Capitella teleta TaxID=283909 RepID=R7TZ79_CAPTE|nr:hypothetical protein CAPTEDRAFT_186359 [Capitella teleta]|eukprot:ELT96711.1 hypothetical protein CAPTEDRAFT_186359 [Capitella teleta]